MAARGWEDRTTSDDHCPELHAKGPRSALRGLGLGERQRTFGLTDDPHRMLLGPVGRPGSDRGAFARGPGADRRTGPGSEVRRAGTGEYPHR
ncbi:hypothetical protein ACIRVF_14995 [Kitasatospora sp. NPDC101157]|uniref:hypothetical protein n=1 Tax=Kitasatospora sp. NPDC101157 TaxID=3364098 RepID=UPI00380B3F5D